MKLDGLKVLDLSAFLPGPYLTMVMADHGADVIMVEPANGVGEPTRVVGYRTRDDVSVWFRNISRGKRSLKINLKDPDGHALFMALAKEADVIVEAFRPGVVTRLGVDYNAVRALNPAIVYCSISAFGQTGPLRDKPGHDLTIQGLAGVADLNRGLEDDKPAMPNMPSADSISSLLSLSAIMMALYRREKTGEGDFIDMSMHDALMSWTVNVTGPVFAENEAPVPKTMRSFGGAAFYNIYETADGQFVILGGSEFKFAKNLLEALERPDLISLCKEEPGPAQDPVKDFLRDAFRSQPMSHWTAFLDTVDVCWSPVASLKEAFEHPHAAHRGMVLKDEAGNTHIGPAIHYANEPAQPVLANPGFGEHSEEIAREAGLAPDKIAETRARGVI